MSNFLEVALASLTGITVFYVFEGLYYEVKARIRGKQYTDWLEQLEEEHQK
jgi:hypothetical protein